MNEFKIVSEETHDKSNKLWKFLNSALLIVALTLVFGALSYALIKVNNAVFQLSIAESMWCGFAMAMAAGYYFYQKRNNTESK